MKVVIVASVLVCFVNASVKVDPLVNSKLGLIRGLLSEDGSYSYFLGIPYGKVDIGSPFGAATPVQNLSSKIFEATNEKVICPQRGKIEDASRDDDTYTVDCLVLNIFIPYEAPATNALPVLVWVHGDEFSNGRGSLYNPEYFMDKGIIVVTINYRLGPYGFICLDVPLVSGNQGLKDQHLALEWIRDYIEDFGGNPQEVTIGGHSAGSTSVFLHLFSPKEKIYKRIIAQSGTPMTEGHFGLADQGTAINLATYLGYNTTDTNLALEFLSKASIDDVEMAIYALNPVLRPCKEMSYSGIENFITTYPFSLYNPEKVKDTPMLIGHVNGESADTVTSLDYDLKSNYFAEKIKESFIFDSEDELLEASEMLRLFYIGDEDISTEKLLQIINFESDFRHNYPMQRMITSLLVDNAGPIYQYLFSYVGDSGDLVASHGDDLKYLFKQTEQVNDVDKILISQMTTLWANFVKYGDPTPSATEMLPITWPPASPEKRYYLQLDKKLEVKSRVYNDRLTFWELFYRLYEKYHKFIGKCINSM